MTQRVNRPGLLLSWILNVAVLFALALLVTPAFAQAPSSLQEQIQRFNSLPPAQQQALLSELQSQLPPAQRDAILGMLRRGQRAQQAQPGQQAAGGASTQTGAQARPMSVQDLLASLQAAGYMVPLRAGDTLVIQFMPRQEGGVLSSASLSQGSGVSPQLQTQGSINAPAQQQAQGGASPGQQPQGGASPGQQPQGGGSPGQQPQSIGSSGQQIEGGNDFALMQQRFADGNPYKLDDSGQLELPGVPPIQLSGLTVDQATIRLEAEPALRAFAVVITRLPLDNAGAQEVKPFGYDLFNNAPSTFAPATDIPVPADYVVGPGDTINVQLFGNQNNQYFLLVSREGTIDFPQIGPLTVSGLTLTQLRQTISQRVSQQMIGVQASTTLGQLRSIRVFVLGDVEQPGSYTVSGLSTMTNALFASGGVTAIGSLRKVELRRDGKTVSTLDLYDLLLHGDTSHDARLQPGDVIFVPPIGPTVTIDGKVRRPAIYELKGEKTIRDVIALAGGLTPDASQSAVKLERIVPGSGVTVRDVNLTDRAQTDRLGVRNGDSIHVQANLDQLEGAVRLSGNVYRPGLYQWHQGMTLSELLPGPDLVKPKSDLHYVLIRRETEPNIDIEPLSADLQAIWDHSPGAQDLELKPRDTVYVFNLDIGRQRVIKPIIAELKAQAATNQPAPTVTVGGQVRAAGTYPLEPGMRVSDLLRAGGGLNAAAYSLEAELTRYDVVNGERREMHLLDVDLAAVLKGERSADIALMPYDYLNVKEVPRWREQESVTIKGEVRFPGTYPIRQGEKLSSVLQRAGGLTDLAFPQGSVFTRVYLRQREANQLNVLADRLQSDLASVALSDPSAAQTLSAGRNLVQQLRSTKAVGRLVIDLPAIAKGNPDKDVVLRDGDELFIPQTTQEVMVLGEVQNATSLLWSRGLSREDYIAMSGGLTNRADKKRIYVVRANGEVVANTGAKWFQRSSHYDIEPGDAIVVPLDTERLKPLTAWQSITQVLYNIAIAFSVISKI